MAAGMSESLPRPRVVLLTRIWDHGDEAAFVQRSMAAAISRFASIDVLSPGPEAPARSDGAFSVSNVGQSGPGEWPEPGSTRWPGGPIDLAVLDCDDHDALGILEHVAPDLALVALRCRPGPVPERASLVLTPSWAGRDIDSRGTSGERMGDVGLHIPVNPIATLGRHNAIGFSDYLLVLSDRHDCESNPPTALGAWLCAGTPSERVVIIEDAGATVWWGRSPRGAFRVDTRTDLWRLMAHARMTVDLAPGPSVARECVESLRFATPVVAPAGSMGEVVGSAGGGLWFRDPAELLGCVDKLRDEGLRDEFGTDGRAATDAAYGDPSAFVRRVRKAIFSAGLLG